MDWEQADQLFPRSLHLKESSGGVSDGFWNALVFRETTEVFGFEVLDETEGETHGRFGIVHETDDNPVILHPTPIVCNDTQNIFGHVF